MSRKSKKRVKAGKKAAVTRQYNKYLAREKSRRETPFRFHSMNIVSGLKKLKKKAGW